MRRNKHLAYEDRLRYLKVPTLSYWRIRGDMIELYKIITGKYDSDCGLSLYLRSGTVLCMLPLLEGINLNLVPQHCMITN